MEILPVIKQFIKQILTGLTLSQEYVCLDLVGLESTLSVSFEIDNNGPVIDVTHSHLFLGYKPLIVGLIAERGNASDRQTVGGQGELFFKQTDKKIVARIQIRKITQFELGDRNIFLYEGVEGTHLFLDKLHQWTNTLIERFRPRKAGNVGLDGNLYEQVRIAYSVPRVIAIITVSDGASINLFPTDLHGPVGSEFYIGSLRINGLANEQVEKYQNIVISEVEANAFRRAYSLGKNHMKTLRNRNEFELSNQQSKIFGYPLPVGTTRYREMTKLDSIDHGIHRLHVYKVVNVQKTQSKDSTLAHIHQYYAQWRMNEKLQNHFLIR